MSSNGARKPWLEARAERSPRLLCVRWQGRDTTFAELERRVRKFAAQLAGTGIGAGDRVAVLAPPSIGFVEAFHAVHRLAAVLVPLPPSATATELAGMLDRAKPHLLVFAGGLGAKARAALGLVRRPRQMGRAVNFTDSVDESGQSLVGLRAAGAALARGAPQAAPRGGPLTGARLEATAGHSIVFTSGTAGACKAVLLTNANQEASALASSKRLAVSERDRWLACMPLHHIGGISILVRNVVAGTAFVLHPRFDPGAVDHALRNDGITIVSLVPTMLARVIETAGGRPYPDRLRIVLTGGGPLSADLVSKARELRLPVVPTYGLTEAASQVCTAHPRNTVASPAEHATTGWSGFPLDGTSVEIAQPDKDGVGEIVVRAPTLTPGYWRDPEATARLLRGGRLHTGDLGRLCSDGSLVVECRRRDLIVSGGENVYPGEVETALLSHDEVEHACVYARPDPEWGQSVHAAVVLRRSGRAFASRDTDAMAQDLRAHCAATLSRFKLPCRFRFLDALPQTAGGKIDREAVARSDARSPSDDRSPSVARSPGVAGNDAAGDEAGNDAATDDGTVQARTKGDC